MRCSELRCLPRHVNPRIQVAPAFWFWILAWYVGGQLQRRKAENLFWILPAFLTWLTVLLGPTYLVRYVIILWYIAPLFIMAGLVQKAKFDEQM